jgi:hypothetical protein
VIAAAQTPQPPYSLFQYASLTGSLNTVSATHIPVVTAAGAIRYVNMLLQFDVDANGNLSISPGFPQFLPAPAVQVSALTAGRYAGPGTVYSGSMAVIISGPGITDGGATEWSLAAAPDAAGCTYPASASWYVGPTASNPLAARLQSAGISSTAWSYGITSGSQCTINGDSWGPNALTGISQTGNMITIVSFTKAGKDYPVPVDQITYTLVRQAGNSN